MDQATYTAIKELGFPIVAAVSCAACLAFIGRWAMKWGERLMIRFEQHLDANDAAQAKIAPALERIETKAVCRAPGPTPHRPTPRTA